MTWNQIHVRYPGLAAFIDGKLAESSIFLLGFSIFGMAMSAFSYRRRELWAWFAMWYTIIFVLGVMALAKGAIDVTGLAPAMLVIVLLGLLLPVRTFFRRKSDQGAA